MTGRDLLARLPGALGERVHEVGAADRTATGGSFVLYWMRTSVRGHENPALDVALVAARTLGLPVFVYHALSERYPYASDRLHRFILEGARDVSAELAERGIGYAFHLERPGHRGPHLKTLARASALVVTEDLPVAPLEGWTASVAAAVDVPVWAVDAACTHPMRLVAARDALRAFRFRDVTMKARLARIRAGWHDQAPHTPAFVPALPFEPVDLADPALDLDALVASCAIDHSIAPVPHTPGGSRAGYARWAAFCGSGSGGTAANAATSPLARYHRTRNDPLRGGVSRMSAYLHFGHVSPMRIAREALAVVDAGGAGGEGADKYLDELLVWRELAHSWCAHHPERDTVAAIPDWARATLAAHERDERPLIPSWSTLARARTGDTLWDAAQRSLLIHGELHNNVRMTWGKALLGWTRSADEALAHLLDLNHRYALDGRDPSSYGGILWCLGQFDRPFSPEQPVVGTVRPRPTSEHARRFDVRAWARETGRPTRPRPPRVAVIGAGLSGLACARTLQDHGVEVRVFDKGRRAGGRLATRESRAEPGLVFDHGAQYLTAHDPRFAREVASWAHDGVVERWQGRVLDVDADGTVRERPAAVPRWVGVGGMQAIAAHVAADLDVVCGVRVGALARDEQGSWDLVADDGSRLGRFDDVVITVPPTQAVPLLAGDGDESSGRGAVAPDLAGIAARAVMLPCWTAMVAFGDGVSPQLAGAGFDGARFAQRALAWARRQSTAASGAQRWVLQASADWSAAHLEDDADAVAEALLADFLAAVGADAAAVTHLSAHRWRYARPWQGPGNAAEERRIVVGASGDSRSGGLVLAGDWVCGADGARLEAAWLSGVAAAAYVMAH